MSSSAACAHNSPLLDFATRSPEIKPAVVMFSSLAVDFFMPAISSVESAFRSASFSLYFSIGCPVIKNPRISFSAASRVCSSQSGWFGSASLACCAVSSAHTPNTPCGWKVRLASVHWGGFDCNPHRRAFVDVLRHVIRAARHRSEQRRHEIDWMVRLQICGVIRQQRVCRGVRFVESVSGKLRHQIKNLLNLLRRKSALRCSLHKALALLGHLLGILFAHRPPQQVGLSEGEAGKLVRRLHYLLLIDEDA